MNLSMLQDHEYLTVRELAELLRLKERKIYDLAASGEVPCSRATGKLLFPASEIRNWIESAKSGGPSQGVRAMEDRPAILLGSHDPLLDWAIRQSGCGLATYYDGSYDGLERFVRGEGVAAGVHIHDARTGTWNLPAVTAAAAGQNAVLISFASRSRGLVFRKDGPCPAGIADLAGLRLAPRQPQSGTDRLFADIAEAEGLDTTQFTLTEVARTEDEAVEMVRRGEADVTFGLANVAQSYGLAFTPLIEEEFGLLLDRKAWFEPPLQALIQFCQSDRFRQRTADRGGYSLERHGEILWNA